MTGKIEEKNIRLPAYPLVTVDPFFSIWSRSDAPYDCDTSLWTGHRKTIRGYVYIDGKKYRFLGKGKEDCVNTVENSVDFIFNTYVFENGNITFTVKFWGPHLLDDIRYLAAPVSYVDFYAVSKDGKEHDVVVELRLYGDICRKKSFSRTVSCVQKKEQYQLASIGKRTQKYLNESGDHTSINWGNFYIAGEECGFRKYINNNYIFSVCKGKVSGGEDFEGSFLLAYDDGYALEYFGKKLKGAWSRYYEDINRVVDYFRKERKQTEQKAIAFQQKLKDDCKRYYKDAYLKVLHAAYRQVLAAHKAVYDENGEILYMSKECHSNGCVNTVDVSYPSMPLFLLYNPELVGGMLRGIFAFSVSPVWKYGFAPHDLGRYPICNGQVYGLRSYRSFNRDNSIRIFSMKGELYDYNRQMPVEECGNMLIMSYLCLKNKSCRDLIKNNFVLLKQWADYLVKKGIVLENQLCTDDFAGHSEKNVNLAIKSVTAIACFDKIADMLNAETDKNYYDIARRYAKELESSAKKEDGSMAFSVGERNTWSQKYNLVWDKIFRLGLFEKSVYDAECAVYAKNCGKYGLPLDYRAPYCKSDWMMWSAVLSDDDDTVNFYSEKLLAFLRDTKDRNCFTDYYDCTNAKERSMDHRSVQGGLWLPILAKTIREDKGQE